MNELAFNKSFEIITNQDIFDNLSGHDVQNAKYFKDEFKNYIKLRSENKTHNDYFNKLNTRTDVSQDDKWEIECLEDSFLKCFYCYEIITEKLTEVKDNV